VGTVTRAVAEPWIERQKPDEPGWPLRRGDLLQRMPLSLGSVGLEIDMLSLWRSLGELRFEVVDFIADRGSDLAPKLDQ